MLLNIAILAKCTINIVRDLLQFNVFGHPVLHKTDEWPFDPFIGERRSIEFQKTFGMRAQFLIDQLGRGQEPI